MNAPTFGQAAPAKPKDATHAYAGVAPCGHIVALTVDRGDKRTADDVLDFIQSGLVIDRVTIEYGRKNFGCTCPKPTQETLI